MQFRRAANIYFLIISILTAMYFSPKNPTSMIGTFAFVIILTMLKEAYEDIKRFRSDQEINEKEAMLFNPETQKFDVKKWENIRVGDLIKILENEDFPADILLLRSSNSNGLCFVDTMSLDGETNLKEKSCPSETKSIEIQSIQVLKGEINCELPNDNLDKWDSSVYIEGEKPLVCA